jgi:signal transduction histidine kinase/ActR/RegA family two-component response regulator
MLTHLREPRLLARRSGEILAANVAGAEALGTSVTALEGTSLARFSPDPAILERLQGRIVERPFPVHSRDGRRLLCDARELAPDVVLLRLSGAVEPYTRMQGFFEALSRLHGTIDGGSDTQTLEEISRSVLTTAVTSGGAIAGGVFLIDESGTNLELTGSVAYSDELVDRFRLVPLRQPSPLTDAVNGNEALFLGTAEDYTSRYPDFTKAHPYLVQAIACLPLAVEGEVIGGLALRFRLPWTFRDEDRHFLRALASGCARALRRRDNDGPAPAISDRATSRLARLVAFTQALASALTPEQVNEAIVDMGMVATATRSGGLWLLSKDEGVACLARSVGPTGPRSEDHAAVPIDGPVRMPVLDAIRTGGAVWIESCQQMEERYPEIYSVFADGEESAQACIPLFAGGRCIGGLSFTFEGVHRFTEDERAFLQVLGWHSAQAIERARLYEAEKLAREAAEASQRRSDFLSEASRLLASSLDYTTTLSGLARAAVPCVADWCIVELEEERGRKEPPVAAHADPSKVPLVLEMSRQVRALGHGESGIPGVIRTGTSKLYPCVSVEALREGLPDLHDLFEEVRVVSSMVVPISARGRTIGAISLNSADPARVYDERDLAMAEELGRRAGLAVDNARLYRDAKDADRLKDEFLAMLGHELRNPLAPILTAIDLMELRKDTAFARERAIISRQVKHVVRLVDDLLDVARVTRGKIQLQKEACEVSLVIAKAIEMVTSLAEARAHRLVVSAPQRGLAVLADPVRLSQAVANLLTNAVKYTERCGSIAVSALQEGSKVVIRVRDSGVGIAPEMLPKVFDLFVQEEGTLDRAMGGLGIGLTVAKALVDLHGGAVSAHSAGLGRGSEFVIRLPRTTLEPRAPVPHPPPSTGELMRVLVVDDNLDAAETLGDALEEFECVVRTCTDGPSALAALSNFKPDLALLDIGLPGMDGYELARQLRRLDVGPSVRVVAISGYGQESDKQRSREAGFDEHLVKPMGLETLGEVLDRCRADLPAARKRRS